MRPETEDCACVIMTDGTARIVSASEDVIRVFGWARSELSGRPLSILIPSVGCILNDPLLSSINVVGIRRDGTRFAAAVRFWSIVVEGTQLWHWLVADRAEALRTESTLRQLERELHLNHSFALTGYWQVDAVTRALDWSDDVYRLLGLDPGSRRPTRALFLSFVHEDDRSTLLEAIRGALRHKTGFELEIRVRGEDGINRILVVAGRPSTSGRTPALVGTIFDVTAARETDRTISMLTRAVEQTAEHVMIVDRDGTIEYVNPAFEHSSGYLRSEAVGNTPRILKSGLHEPEFYRDLWIAINAGKSFRGVFLNKRKDGSIYYEEKSISPLRNSRGEITHFVSTGRDITDRQQAEEEGERLRDALHSSVRQWCMTFDAMDTPIVITDTAGVIQRLNRAARDRSGLSFGEVVGRSLMDTPKQQPWCGFRAIFARAPEGRVTEEATGADGTSWEISMHTYVDDDAYTVFVARDVTRLRELQEQIRRNEMMSVLGRLVAGVAHEVRNPLFGMSATIDAFDGQPLDSVTSVEFTRRLRTELGRLSNLMQDLLEYGRPSEPVREDADLRVVIREAQQMVTPLAAKRGVQVHLELGARTVRLAMDRTRMLQVFRNLLENSIDHSGRDSVVQVVLRDTQTSIECAVLDDGPGFRAEDIPLVFEPFFTRRRGGTGLGLSIVKRLVEQHDGEILAGNRRDGGGIVKVRFSRVPRRAAGSVESPGLDARV